MADRIEDVFTAEEVANKLKCSKLTLRLYREAGRIRMFKIGGRWMMKESELRYITSHGLHDYTPEFRELSRKRRAVSRARAKAKAKVKGGKA